MGALRWIGRTMIVTLALTIAASPVVASAGQLGSPVGSYEPTVFARIWHSITTLWIDLATSVGPSSTGAGPSQTVAPTHAVGPPDDGPIGEQAGPAVDHPDDGPIGERTTTPPEYPGPGG